MLMGNLLIEELYEDPEKFIERGRSYQLLQTYFDGYPIETLRPLLQSDNESINRAATFVISELGDQACDLLDEVIPLLSRKNRRIKCEVLESIMVCSTGEKAKHFIHIAQSLEREEKVVRKLAMRFVYRASSSQIKAVLKLLKPSSLHYKGLSKLLKSSALTINEITDMLRSNEALLRRYATIIAIKNSDQNSELIKDSVLNSDQDILEFIQELDLIL